MSFSLQPDSGGKSQVVLIDEPYFIVGLPRAPCSLEDQLRHGRWLVVCFSVWSTHDISAARRALEIAKAYNGKFKLGLRPFDYLEENFTWLPNSFTDIQGETVNIHATEHHGKSIVSIRGRNESHPLWAVLIDGRIPGVRVGLLSEAEIHDLVQKELMVTDRETETL